MKKCPISTISARPFPLTGRGPLPSTQPYLSNLGWNSLQIIWFSYVFILVPLFSPSTRSSKNSGLLTFTVQSPPERDLATGAIPPKARHCLPSLVATFQMVSYDILAGAPAIVNSMTQGGILPCRTKDPIKDVYFRGVIHLMDKLEKSDLAW